MKVAISTLGCRVNIYDTEIMISALKEDDFEVVSYDEFADVYCINTCTVTNTSDKKSRQFISKCKKINPKAIIAMVGCYPQVSKDEVSEIKDVNIILGNRFKGQLPYYIRLFLETGKQVIKVDDNILRNISFEDRSIRTLKDKHRAFIKIQDGCNKFCTYCIIPFARGGVCSKEPRKIFDEVRSLVSNGYKEVVLTGINTTSYGDDLGIDINLVSLIELLDEIDGLERIRVGSVDPEFFTTEIVERMSKIKKLMPHFHLSLQSGCDSVLKRMRRKYDISLYKRVVEDLRREIEDVSITTDIIVGFPGETDDEFNETYNFLKNIKLQDMHVFKYSKRNGTKAAEMENQVDVHIKEKRSKSLIDLNKLNKIDFQKKYLGQTLDVLYCTELSDNNGVYGYTKNYIKVVLNDEKKYLGKIVSTRIVDLENDHLIGQALK
ncbi:tRNA-t(6)A37 methylthiotransferase [Candidatus Arthromitus sp. SFB-mouse-NL]|uniref:tRNA (N(6)-L-threonylcarbamoyladenosine(37)-C(2))- methylthiotransferase MtaB n=1 Tax=Candidatus Arthromitus sp. SFB-mouse-NL TaxID=1508644 RepID=UPI00049AB4E1|nr:tRNA (N(6)-L-threonylcarbamoyladenosine(37)-C(2))-methylthiotransferase MtaB [Candidatus Arthromitus sp. SFB-mouse-NL]AID44911.1 tRNA-t(6)A37 methylthiotransferase [Candidatus Arthromitus sp. SFB-mouse-NL]